MRRRALAILFIATVARPTYAASADFRVELFSHKVVKAFALEGTDQSLTLCGAKSDGPCWTLQPRKQIFCRAERLVRCRLEATERNFTLLEIHSAAPFRLAPTFANRMEAPETFLLRNARVTRTSAGLQIITRVNLESYVSGVLRGEASVLHAPTAREAMAILARTWAQRWQGRHCADDFDFCSLTHCQAFRLPQVRTEAPTGEDLDPAVRVTRGQVLQYHGVLADPYFTACCGGRTEAAGNVWPDRAQPYLISISDPYCRASDHASWKRELTAESVGQVLREALFLPLDGPPADVAVEQRDSSGRAVLLRVVADRAWSVDANQFRYAVDRRLGWNQIQSNLYSIARQGNAWVFSGHGLGHGVGLCQAGAEQMAQMGSSTAQILATYFPGTEIVSPSRNYIDPIASSEHFELVYPASQEPWVKPTLDTLEQWRKELGGHAEVLPPRVRVETWGSVEEFIRATGQPGWMAASSDGQSIALEPLELLVRRQILNQTLRHELTHLVVHRLGAKGVPRWFEEGCVLYLTGERIPPPAATLIPETKLEESIAQPRSEAEMKSAYAQALERVRQYARRKGNAALWRILAHPGPDDLHWLHGRQ